MRVTDLGKFLKKGSIAPLWFITGEEPLLMIEAADAIREHAKNLGFNEREVLNASATWDWSQLESACREIGLFSPQKVIELRLASFRPGVKGAKALSDLAEMPLENVVVIVSMPYDWSVKKLAWFKALSSAAQFVECALVGVKELPGWFANRFKLQGQEAEPEACELLSARCEGNLLAARQELLKLAYQYPKGTRITADMVREAVGDVSRFDATTLIDAVMKGDATRALKILDSLKAEGETIPNVMWMLADEIRAAARVASLVAQGQSMQSALRIAAVFGPDKTSRVRALALRASEKKLQSALCLIGDIDRIGKGLVVASRDADPWLEIASLASFLRKP